MDSRPDIRWVPIGAGRLALWHRPGRRHLQGLVELGCQYVVTLLSEKEGAAAVGDDVRRAGMKWIWLPLPDSKTPAGAAGERLEAALPELSALLDQGASLLIHCSAGIHRTGMVAYGLLRWRGEPREQALQLLAQMRDHTRQGVQERHLAWGDNLASVRQPPPT